MTAINNKRVGKKIKQLRLSLGESMEQFGMRFNTSKGTVNNWEKGRNLPNKKNLKEIASLSNTSVNILLKGDSTTVPFIFPEIKEILGDPEYYIPVCKDLILYNTEDNRVEDLYYMLIVGVTAIFKRLNTQKDGEIGFPPALTKEEWVTCHLFIANFFKGETEFEKMTFRDLAKLIHFLEKVAAR